MKAYEQLSANYLHLLFEIQAEKNKNHTAFIYENKATSYGSLAERSNQLAHRLRKLGVGVGQHVGIALQRNDLAYIAILAILKTGAAYVPFDPECPQERIHCILEDCQVNLLITSNLINNLHAEFPCPVLLLDQELLSLAEESTTAIHPQEINLNPDNTCYIIYTSGSSGKPKGVAISHRNVCHYLQAVREIYQLQQTDKVYQGFSLAFDASVEEIWTAFSAGATLVTTNDKSLRSGAGLAEFLNENQISFFSTVPTLLTMLEPPLTSLRLLILGGEVCHQDLITKWSRPGLTILNTYGPTEATVVTTYTECQPNKPVTIGRPLAGYEVFLLDAQLQPVDLNQEGEIYIGGAAISSGYINHPELNQSKFILHPQFNKRLYRSGDLACRLANGDLQYIGRIDNQIKLRGYRIELDEIEAVIREYPGIRQAVVSIYQPPQGVPSLVAYLLPQQSDTFAAENLMEFLRSRLADYMLPNLLEIVTELPLLASGKIDRKNLPAPKIKSHPHEENYIAPRNQIEQKIAAIWENLFHTQQISIDNNFFYDLGGHSLLAAKAVSLLREDAEFQHLSVLDLYQNPTIRKLALKKNTVDADAPAEDIAKPGGFSYYLCAAAQFIGSLLHFALLSWESLIIILLLTYITNRHALFSWETLATVVGLILIWPLIGMILSIAVKWLILGKVKPGKYKLWGSYYLRWWFAQCLQRLLFPSALAGSPLYNLYCRLMGANIGKNCHIDTGAFGIFDLLTIGDHSSISKGAMLLGYHVENGYFKIGPITIGNRCFVGVTSVLGINTVMEDGSILEDLSMLPPNTKVAKNHHYRGSPAQPVTFKRDDLFNQTFIDDCSLWKNIFYGILHYFSLIFIAMIYVISFAPAIILIDYFYEEKTLLLTALIAVPVGSLIFMLLLCSIVITCKKLLLGKIKAGSYKLRSWFYVRKWTVDHLFEFPEFDVIAESLYFPPLLRRLGMKIGKRVEIAEMPHMTPDMVSIDDESFTASDVIAGTPRIYLGYMHFAPIEIGKRVFLGNATVLPPDTHFADNSLLGVLSIPPLNLGNKKISGDWLGSPPMLLPKREVVEGFSDQEKFTPSKSAYFLRGIIELVRILLPPAWYFFILVGFFWSIDFLQIHYSLMQTFLLFPIFATGIILVMVLASIALKWILMGRYHAEIRPSWSLFIWKRDIVEHLHNYFMVRMVIDPLLGTPFAAVFFRLLGAKIGKRVFINSSYFAEHDLIDIEDDVALNAECIILTHLYEDRIFKMGKIKIKEGCHVGDHSIVIYDTVMEEYSALGNLSLLMKGETLPAYTRWEGLPAQKIKINFINPTSAIETEFPNLEII